jgi:hypothetical protein
LITVGFTTTRTRRIFVGSCRSNCGCAAAGGGGGGYETPTDETVWIVPIGIVVVFQADTGRSIIHFIVLLCCTMTDVDRLGFDGVLR